MPGCGVNQKVIQLFPKVSVPECPKPKYVTANKSVHNIQVVQRTPRLHPKSSVVLLAGLCVVDTLKPANLCIEVACNDAQHVLLTPFRCQIVDMGIRQL